ncbi:type I polyketide synthase [Streptomyces sp. S1A(2023)]
MELATEARAWPESGRARRAGVSSFGISGTNAHVILEEAPPEPAPVPAAEPVAGEEATDPVLPWVFSASSEDAVAAQAAALLSFVDADPGLDRADAGLSLAVARTGLPHRAAVVGADLPALRRGLTALAAGTDSPGVVRGTARDAGGVVFVFPGQGSQWPGMALQLLDESTVFAETMQACADALDPHFDWNLFEVLRDVDALEKVDVLPSVLFAIMVSLAALWRSYGLEPTAVVGNSQGEVAAACVAGALDLADAAKVVALRSKTVRALSGSGGLVSLALPEDEVTEILRRWEGRLSVAVVNAPTSVVVAGDIDALVELVAACEADGIRAKRLLADYASHSAHVEPIKDELLTVMAGLTPRPSRIPFYSTVTADVLDTTGLNGEYWYSNLRERVRFAETVDVLAERGHTMFVEMTPHPVLTAAVEDTREDAVAVGSLRRDDGGLDRFMTSLAEAYARGASPDWRAVFPGARQTDVPTSAFRRQSYWIPLAPDGGSGDVEAAGLAAADHPLLGAVVELPDSGGLVLTGRLSRQAQPWLADHRLGDTVLLPGTAFVELAIRAGDEVGCDQVAELTCEVPLILPPHAGVDVRVTVGGPDRSGRCDLAVHARPADGSGGWTRHASGALASGRGEEFDLTAWPPPGAEAVEWDGGYGRWTELGYHYGPAFQGLRAWWRRGSEIFAEVALEPETEADATRYGLHPALLDAALHPVVADGKECRLPFSWQGVSLRATGASTLRVWITPDGADTVSLRLADGTGAPVASVESLALLPIPAGEAAVGPADGLFRVDWLEAGVPELTGGPRSWALTGADDFGLGLPSHAHLAALADTGTVPEGGVRHADR